MVTASRSAGTRRYALGRRDGREWDRRRGSAEHSGAKPPRGEEFPEHDPGCIQIGAAVERLAARLLR